MADNKKATSKSKKTVNKNKSLELSNEELFDQIKAKKNSKTSTSKKNTKKNVTSQKKKTDSIKDALSNEEILEQILAKKKNKKNKSSDIELPKLKGKTKKKSLSSDDNDLLLENILNKKKNKVKKEKVIKSDSNELTEIPKIDFKKPTVSKKKVDVKSTEDKIKIKVSEKDKNVNVTTVDKKDKLSSVSKDVNQDKKQDKKVDSKQVKTNISVNKHSVDKRLIQSVISLLLVIVILVFGLFIYKYKDSLHEAKEIKEQKRLETIKEEEERIKNKNLYEECLVKQYNELDNTESINNYINEINMYLSSMKVSVSYVDLEYGFTYSYNENQVYYAASTIKALDALYIYTKASSGEINLDNTVIYSKKYKNTSSAYTGTLKLGTAITIRDLVKYAVMVSDNGCHQMLVDYIGRDNLKAFGNSLGAKYTLSSSDNFGNISTSDGLIYMKALNNYFDNNGELGAELKSYFVNSDENGLKSDNFEAATKYGEYTPNFHNIGVVYSEHPYLVSILTSEKSGDFVKKIYDINQMINHLNEMYYSNRPNICYTNIYGN